MLVKTKRGRCETHMEKPWERSGPEVKRIRGSKLQKLRRRLFQKNPLCVECLKHGVTTLATQRDHIQPLGEGGSEDVSNTQALCETCNKLKALEEAKRGFKRYHQA